MHRRLNQVNKAGWLCLIDPLSPTHKMLVRR